jgi:DNA-binding transcriptional MerR regulator
LDNKAPEAFRTISEVAEELDLPQHVLRFWETRFRDIKPMKRGGGRRFYRPEDIALLRGIRHLLYGEGYTIRGVQRILREQGVGFVQTVWQAGAAGPARGVSEQAPRETEIERETELEEEAASAAEMAQEESGLGSRFASLFGRDIWDRQDDAAERREPPLKSAPVPRLEPDDRALHGSAAALPAVEPVLPAMEPARPPRVAEPAPAKAPELPREDTVKPTAASTLVRGEIAKPIAASALTRDDIASLQAALHELGECRKLIEVAVARAE